MEIKIKWIKGKQMTHENTYRDDTILIIMLQEQNNIFLVTLKFKMQWLFVLEINAHGD